MFSRASSILIVSIMLIVIGVVLDLYAQESKQPIIDMHLHCYDQTTYWVAPDEYGKMSPPNADEHFKQTYELMEKYNIVKGVISGRFNAVNTWMDRDSDRRFIRGILVYAPGESADRRPKPYNVDTLQFENWVKEGKIEIFGEIGAAYEGYSLAHPGFEPYLRICEEYDIPVAIHTGGGWLGIELTWPRYGQGDPLLLKDVLVKFPKLRMYMMHAGDKFYESALSMMGLYPQLYADLGVLLWSADPRLKPFVEDFLKKAREAGSIDRVMFGSDQMVWPHAIEMSIEYLDSLSFLSEEEKRGILFHNAARFLRLDQEEYDFVPDLTTSVNPAGKLAASWGKPKVSY